MSTNVEIQGTDGRGFLGKVNVSQIGQLIVGPYTYDTVVAKTSTNDNTAVNFYLPKVHEQFVITGVLLTSDSNVQGSAIIDVYEASAIDSTVIDKSILHIDLLKNQFRDIIGLNLKITQGKYLNLKADDSDVSATIMGYYIPEIINGT